MDFSLKNKTILQVLPSLTTGGVEQTTLDITQALIQKGATAIIASSGGPLVKTIENLGGIHIDLPLASKNPLILLKNYKAIKKIIKKYKVDLVHARSRAPAWSAFFATKSTHIPFVTTYHGIYNHKGPLKNFYNSIMARGDLVIANSSYTAQYLHKMHKTSLSHIRVIHRGVNLSIFDPNKISEKEKNNLKSTLGFNDPRKTILVLPGRLTRWKGQILFVQVLSHLPKGTFYALISGNSQGRNTYVEELQSAIKNYHLSDSVRLYTKPLPMPLLLSIADGVISPSTDAEAFGRIMAEASAMEKPVIASAHGGALEIIESNKTGFLFSNKDSSAFTQVLTNFLALSPKQRHKLGKQGRQRIISLFSNEAMCKKTLSVYQELLFSMAPDSSLLASALQNS